MKSSTATLLISLLASGALGAPVKQESVAIKPRDPAEASEY